MTEVWPGRPFPLGALWDGAGTNFSLFSEHAEGVELCLFDDAGEETRIEVGARRALNWHCYLPGVGPGQRYGFRVHGPYAPADGHRFNPDKLLLDPYAKAIDGVVDWAHDVNVLPYVPNGGEDDDYEPDDEDDAGAVPEVGRGRPDLRLGGRHAAAGAVHRHAHLRDPRQGLHDASPRGSRGPARDVRGVGLRAGDRLPQASSGSRRSSCSRCITSPTSRSYSSEGFATTGATARSATSRRTPSTPPPVAAASRSGSSRGMVKALHQAGIEVILDVVYNHTAEGNHLGPMLSFKGIDNSAYYRLMPDDPRHYMDFTGTGNSLNPVHPSVLRLIMDSLRYWVVECHVDGFRFDLASALAREFFDVDRLSAFFDTIHQDPVLSQVKLIAEPWDVGPGGYQVGNFPILWSEWNGVYRDTMRDFWRASASVGEFASRLAGSADLYESDGRDPFASINFITAHDGFTLRDLVTYEVKHNEANLEDNHDGTDDNRSWNCGVEGESDDPEIRELRRRQQRNFLTTLLISQGTPMLLGGDERNRTQGGNNNGWCHDSELSWYDWNEDPEAQEMHAFTRRLIRLRSEHCSFRRESFLRGQVINGFGLPDVWWFRADGRKMTNRDWQHGEAVLGMFLNGDAILNPGPHGEAVSDDSFVLLFNAHAEDREFKLPRRRMGTRWELELCTADPGAEAGSAGYDAQALVNVTAHSITILKRVA